MRKFWREINVKKRKVGISEKIEREQWIQYFRKQFLGYEKDVKKQNQVVKGAEKIRQEWKEESIVGESRRKYQIKRIVK